jgi:cell division protein FtsA
MKQKENNKLSDEIIVGLDIGTTKIAAMVGQMNENGKLEILGYGHRESHGVKRGVVNNIERTVEAIGQAIEAASQMSKVDIHTVHVGIAGQHIRSLQHKGSIMRNSLEEEISRMDILTLTQNMYKLVMQPGEEILHVIPQEFIVDKEQGIKDPVGMSGICLEANFHIITGQVAAAKNLERCVNKANLVMTSIMLEPLASADAVLSEEEKEAGVALVDIGGGTTDIAVFQEGILRHTAVIPLGGDIVTDDVKEGCTILKYQAEALKIKFGSALASENRADEIVAIPGLKGRDPKEISLRNLAGIIQARMEEIIEQVYYEVKNSGYEKKLIGGIVLTGGGSMVRHLAQLTQFMTGMDTRIGLPQEHLAASVPKEIISPMYATTIGLVLKGFERLADENLRQKKGVKKPNKSGKSIFSRLFDKGKGFFDEDIE